MSTDSEALRRRLERLKRRASQRESPLRSQGPRSARALPAGRELKTPAGSAYVIEQRFEMDHRHGQQRLSHLLGFDGRLAAEVSGSDELAQANLRQLAFVDTETTGLAGGAGTLVFLVGLGRFEEEDFVLRQYFLRDPQEESAMLTALNEPVASASGFVTFNGRAFDIPLLEMRYVMALRERRGLTSYPHLDLLFPSRRLWRRELPNCRLGTIEKHVLKVVRSEADVPGEQIPGMYLDYLRTGDVDGIERILYHNTVDVLSLVGLAGLVLNRFQESDPARLSGGEALAVARWHSRAGRSQRATAAFKAATLRSDDQQLKADALRLQGAQAKREQDYAAAVPAWEAWHSLAEDDPRPCIELAKYYEWHARDLSQAQTWTQRALVTLSHWPDSWRRKAEWEKVEHRMRRLKRKLDPTD